MLLLTRAGQQMPLPRTLGAVRFEVLPVVCMAEGTQPSPDGTACVCSAGYGFERGTKKSTAGLRNWVYECE